jgi:hypothetical protein
VFSHLLATIKMRNSSIHISNLWEVKRDEFYEIDPLDDSIDDERKFNDLFCQEDLLWIKKSDFNIDLGWYGEKEKGHFGLYLYKGTDWHNCQLFEKRNTNNYKSIIDFINQLIKNVDSGRYDSTMVKFTSIDEYSESEVISVLNEK